MDQVKVTETVVVIPTYKPCAAEKGPLFIEKRAYQGSSGKVYPLPVTEKISDEKTDVEYKALILENEYLYVMILPEIGGKIHRAYDKTNGYDFVYFNHVIKPALVGLVGPWVSGGIEFNWPQHHRPSTFSPVDYHYERNSDGSCSVYVGETDKMYGTKGMAKISLYPGKAYIEICGQLYNPTDIPQTFLWWANPAVPVNDDTYSVFPPDVNAVMDHGKRAVSTFPIATGEYYKYDYSEGVDISRYKNIKVPTSYMAAHSDFDFIGNYDEKREAGLLHVADHHFSPGKKQWTWGSGDFGISWDRNLTDEDGPYIELMTGVYADNQPDFTWLKPHEEKIFTQYFMPYKGVGRVLNATKEASVGVECNACGTKVKVYATAEYPEAKVIVSNKKGYRQSCVCTLSPEKCWEWKLDEDLSGTEYIVTVADASDRLLVRCEEYKAENKPIPQPAEQFKKPEELKSCEELYLAGEHLEQYRHATYDPEPYYLEGLRRDPTDIRLNNTYGLYLYKHGQVEQSIRYFERAIEKQTWKTPNPYSGECYYNLGLALQALGKIDKAYDAFYKSTWSDETRGTGYYHLAQIKAIRGEYGEALRFARIALVRNWHDMKVRGLIAAMQRKLGATDEAFLAESLAIDPLAMNILYEEGMAKGALCAWREQMRGEAFNYLELAFDYLAFGMYDDAIAIASEQSSDPMLHYLKAYAYVKKGDSDGARFCVAAGDTLSTDYCFPNRVEEIAVLENAIALRPESPNAYFYLGNLFYDKKVYARAIELWEKAVECKPDFAMAHRNLSIAYFNKTKDNAKALASIERACALDPDYPRFLLECDQLRSKIGFGIKERLEVLESRLDVVEKRDDLYLRYISLLNCAGRFADALAAIERRTFHSWEGGEGKVSAQYKYALIGLAKQNLAQKNYDACIGLLERTLSYPVNLGEGKLPNVPDNQANYYMGIAYREMGNVQKSQECFERASKGDLTPDRALYYHDQPSDYIYYAGLAFAELGNTHMAKKAFNQLISFGERHIFDEVGYDYFAVSLPEIEVYQDELSVRNRKYCNYLAALGYAGKGNSEKAKKLCNAILAEQADDQGAIELLRNL